MDGWTGGGLTDGRVDGFSTFSPFCVKIPVYTRVSGTKNSRNDTKMTSK